MEIIEYEVSVTVIKCMKNMYIDRYINNILHIHMIDYFVNQ
jgi:hypothetical protein